MQNFYMIIGKNELFLYEKNENGYVRQFIEGNSEYSYKLNNAKNDVDRLIKSLVNEYNMETSAEIEFVVIDNENTIYSEIIEKALGEYVAKKNDLKQILTNIIKKLKRDNKLMIDELGINFDGKNYVMSNNKLIKNDYSLLGYTLHADDIMKFY
ncbi:hypothetical protein ACQPV1_18475 [Clostridium neonatale]|uniref:hypothetical protein n=1 Tax=Clostridium neonatale TaxID=137838 RepID=UPI003D33B0DC